MKTKATNKGRDGRGLIQMTKVVKATKEERVRREILKAAAYLEETQAAMKGPDPVYTQFVLNGARECLAAAVTECWTLPQTGEAKAIRQAERGLRELYA